MKIELNERVQPVSFHLIHPASCFVWEPEGTKEGTNPSRNVWLKVAGSAQAVNLWSGDLKAIGLDAKVYPIALKVVEA